MEDSERNQAQFAMFTDDGPTSFTKHDRGKDQWSKFPWRAARAVMNIMKHGAAKYGWDNWRQADNEQLFRYLDATMRHIVAEMEGEEIDDDSGEDAVHHALCSLMFYVDCKERDKGKSQEDLAALTSYIERKG